MRIIEKKFKNLEFLFNTSNFFLYKFLRKIVRYKKISKFIVNKKDLAFFYDLNVNQISHDFAHYLVQAEEFRRKKKLESIDIFIIKSNYKITARMMDFSKVNSRFEVENRAYEIIFALTRLLKSVLITLLIYLLSFNCLLIKPSGTSSDNKFLSLVLFFLKY